MTGGLFLILMTTLLAACGLLLLVERRGLKMTLELNRRGDVKRETRWVAQYGQFTCTVVAAALVWSLDPERGRRKAVMVLLSAFGASLLAQGVKRLVGRVRPGRADAGRFLGPTIVHDNGRESFPSSHSASAAGLSAVLSMLYPEAAVTFCVLALLCAALRYVLDAHWPSDVAAGVALGLGVGYVTWLTLRP